MLLLIAYNINISLQSCVSQYLRIWIRSDRRNMDNLKRKWSSRPIESVSHPSWKDISIMKQALCQPITIPWTAYPLPLTHNSNSYTIRSQIHIVIFNHSKHTKIHKGINLEHCKFKYLFFLRPSSLNPNPLLETVLYIPVHQKLIHDSCNMFKDREVMHTSSTSKLLKIFLSLWPSSTR